MKKPMTLEDALSISIQNMESRYAEYEAMMENSSDYSLADEMQELKQAANIMRNMAEEPVVNTKKVEQYGCTRCEIPFLACECKSDGGGKIKKYTKTWTGTRVLKIVEQKTDVKFEKVD